MIDAGFECDRIIDMQIEEEGIDDSATEMFKNEEDNVDFLKVETVSDWENAIDRFKEKEEADGCSWQDDGWECDGNGDVDTWFGKDDGKRPDGVDMYKEEEEIDDSAFEKLIWESDAVDSMLLDARLECDNETDKFEEQKEADCWFCNFEENKDGDD